MISLRKIFLTFFDHVFHEVFNENGVKFLIHDITDNCAADIVFSGEKPAQDWV